MKILYLTNLDVESVYQRLKTGEKIDRHNFLYGYDVLKDKNEIILINTYKRTIFTRILNRIGLICGFAEFFLQLKTFVTANKKKA